jgi:hypothetical protein
MPSGQNGSLGGTILTPQTRVSNSPRPPQIPFPNQGDVASPPQVPASATPPRTGWPVPQRTATPPGEDLLPSSGRLTSS